VPDVAAVEGPEHTTAGDEAYGIGTCARLAAAGVPEPLPAVASHIGCFDVLDVLLDAGVPPALYLAL
jgi:hypothetical protein